jgi:hypothetical protein
MFRIWIENESGKQIVRHVEEMQVGEYSYSEIPTKPEVTGRTFAQLVRDDVTGTLSWEIVDRPPTEDELVQDANAEIERLKSDLLEAQNAINFLLGV